VNPAHVRQGGMLAPRGSRSPSPEKMLYGGGGEGQGGGQGGTAAADSDNEE
jgi:hypothetical protein